MAMSSVAAARFRSAYQQAVPSVGSHKHGHQGPSLATIGDVGSSAASATSTTDKVGRKLDLIA